MKKLFMIDGHALVFRAYYALLRRPMINSKGVDTSAIFGFCKSLFDIILKENPSHLLVAFDPSGKNFRHEMYPLYKANREATPEQIKLAIPIIRQILEACDIPVFVKDGVEADDVIGTLAKQTERAGFDVFMVTPDKDYGQLVSPHISIFRPGRKGDEWEILGVKEICNKYGIDHPIQVIDILTIWGDSSDNVPGVNGVGEVGAKKLVGGFKSVENIYAHLDELSPKNQERFREAQSHIALSKDLVTIRTNLDIEWSEQDLQIKTPSLALLRDLFLNLEFHSLMRILPQLEERFACKDAGMARPAQSTDDSSFTPITEFEEMDSLNRLAFLHAQALQESSIALRLMTDNEEFMRANIIGLALFIPNHTPVYLKTIDQITALKPLFEDSSVSKIGYGLKETAGMLSLHGISLKGKLWDIGLMHYIINPELSHRLDGLCRQYLSYNLPTVEDSAAPSADLFCAPADPYQSKSFKLHAIEEARACYFLQSRLYEILKTEEMLDLYLQIEMPLMAILSDMEREGVRVDTDRLRSLGQQWASEAATIEAKIREYAQSPDLNVSSPKQLGIVLYEKMAIDGGKRKESKSSKAYSTDEESLNSLLDAHPIVPLILEYRSLNKLVSSYTKSLPTLVLGRTNRIHTTFNQLVTATGRLSSKNPNLQNIPIREARGRELRKAFVPRNSDYLLMSADYSQIELRLMAHMSQDPDMLDAFRKGEDIHAATAAKIFHIPISEVSKEQRSRAKVANFGILYGISSFGLSQRLSISRKESKAFIEDYFLHYPRVKSYIDSVIEFAREHGYVETLFHRKRYTPDIKAANAVVRALSERNATNAPIQGTAADVIKIAMVRIQNAIEAASMQSRMILQVHDELVFDVYKPEQEALQAIVKEAMEHAADLDLPLTVEIGFGNNWLEAH